MIFSLLFSIMILLSACNEQNSPLKQDVPLGSPDKAFLRGTEVMSMDQKIMIIFQDSKNSYWFGSMDQGVYQYDEKKLFRYTTEDGLASNRIRSIQEDKHGNIYFDSGEGITKFDGRSFTILRVVDNSTNQWRLHPDDLWFEGKWNENGPYRFDGTHLFHLELSNNKFENEFHSKYPNASFSPYDVYSIYKDQKGHLWFGTSTLGVCRYNGKSFDWIWEEELTELDDDPALGIRSIIEDKEGNFWFSKPFHRYKISNDKLAAQKNTLAYEMLEGLEPSVAYLYGFMSMVKDGEENLWMATYDQGVWKYDGQNLTHYPIKEDDKMITSYALYRDRQNNLWLGTHNSGPYRFNGKQFEKFLP